ncbi:hypothetical protein H4R20_006984, partial [Coemansia guatemalensis]
PGESGTMSTPKEHAEGKLEIRVVAGRKMPRRSRMSKGDAKISMTLGTSTKSTQVDKKGGATPQWNDLLTFLVAGLGKTQLHVVALEVESAVTQRKIGSCVVDLTKIFVEEVVDGWYSLTSGDKPAGDVYLEFTYIPKGGRRRPVKDDSSDENDEDPLFQVEPKARISSSTVASAPAMLQKDGKGSVKNSPAPIPASVSAHVQMRPSMSDLRPYSSASMHDTGLANKYAQKHGKKPLPNAPAMMAAGQPAGFQSHASSFDQTMMPGQAQFMQQQQPYQEMQRPISYA